MASKAEEGFTFQGIPEAIYTDNGPIAKSRRSSSACWIAWACG
jgi:hypothetical protein